MTLIKCDKLCMGYESNMVLNNITFTVEESDFLCIIGENGSGKSTLIKGLLGLKSVDSGTISFDNSLKNNDIGFMSQQHDLIDNFPASVEEVVLSGRLNSMKHRPFYNKADKETAARNMTLLKITDIKSQRFADLSGGQKQRVLLARALCATKKILILDEPTAGLDPNITNEFYELISSINAENNITIIMVSHDIAYSVKNSNKILHLGNDDYFFGKKEEYLNSGIGKRFLKGLY